MEGWVINGGMSLLYCMCFQRERGPAVGCRAGADSCSAPGLSRGMWPTRGTATRAGRARGQAAATAGHWCTHSCMSVNTHFVFEHKTQRKTFPRVHPVDLVVVSRLFRTASSNRINHQNFQAWLLEQQHFTFFNLRIWFIVLVVFIALLRTFTRAVNTVLVLTCARPDQLMKKDDGWGEDRTRSGQQSSYWCSGGERPC